MNEPNVNNIEILFEQYKMFVETAEQVTNRRQKLNQYYITALTSLIGIPYALGIDIFKEISFLTIFIGFIGCLMSVLWIVNLISAKQLNKAKFEIIQEIEIRLPYKLYTKEWKLLAEGRDSKVYLEATKVELLVPIVLGLPYLGLFIYALNQLT